MMDSGAMPDPALAADRLLGTARIGGPSPKKNQERDEKREDENVAEREIEVRFVSSRLSACVERETGMQFKAPEIPHPWYIPSLHDTL
jgi:hypothetical protein